MATQVIINISEVNLLNGFYILVDIKYDSDKNQRFIAILPQVVELEKALKDWQDYYRLSKDSSFRKIRLNESNSTNISSAKTGGILEITINEWLNSAYTIPEEENLSTKLRTHLNINDEIQVIIQTDNQILRQLPWHLWSFFKDYIHSEFALSPLSYKSIITNINNKNKVRILAILGDSTGIDIEADKKSIEKLPGAEIIFLEEPDYKIIKEQLWNEEYDILFFAGHSFSRNNATTGEIAINSRESVPIVVFKEALRRSAQNGLKLAIFNSCDGLGLAQEIISIIPNVIAIRESITNLAAQKFLEFFLSEFARDKSIFLSVRYARDRLKELENENEAVLKFSSWLPTISYSPHEKALTWDSLRYRKSKKALYINKINKIKIFSLTILTPFIGLSLLLVPLINSHKQEEVGVKIKEYCQEKYSNFDFIASDHKDVTDPYRWKCINKKTGESYPLRHEDFNKMCQSKGYKKARYIDKNSGFSWRCYEKYSSLMQSKG